MKLKEYIKKLEKIAKKNPNALVITSSDDEGNDFHEVVFDPTLGNFKDREFDPESGEKPNAVCLN